MKRIWLFALLTLVTIAGSPGPRLQAYSPHYLPGGKNYLSADNFQYASGRLSAIEPFLVKPYTDYALTLPRWYAENAAGSEVTLTFFCDEEELDTLIFDPYDDFSDSGGTNYWFMTFRTPVDVNYLSLSFEDGRDPFSVTAISEMQLEEGTTFTGLEAYVAGTVTDVNGPYFQGNPVVISNVDDPLSLEDIQAGISAFDVIDGEVTGDIEVISDQYTGNRTILGNYTILFRVSDQCLNSTEFTMTVKVVDVNPPLITGPGTVVVPHPQTRTIPYLAALLTASDQHEGSVVQTLNVVSDGYTANAGTVGDYEVIFEASDTSGNRSTYSLTVSVVDQAAPVFSGISEITIGYDHRLSAEDIRAMLQAQDGYDGDLTTDIILTSDGYSAHLHEVGQYLLVFAVTDAGGNTAEKTVCVRVVDLIGPIIYFDASVIRVYNTTVLTLTDFTTLLVRADELAANTAYVAEVRFDSYTGHASVPGTYHLTVDYVHPNGTLVTKSLQIVVREKPIGNIDGIPVGPVAEPSFFEKNRSWIIGSVLAFPVIVANVIFFFLRRKPH
ncbi:MAG TPA: hypothetical protein P5154_05345 [Candidatus Izemoplasmatales bacterium]|nr:hypothetical protein [Candidatus Izemoplasmatales bacterium]